MLLLFGVGKFPCLVVIVDLLGSAYMVVVVVEKLYMFFLGLLSGACRSS